MFTVVLGYQEHYGCSCLVTHRFKLPYLTLVLKGIQECRRSGVSPNSFSLSNRKRTVVKPPTASFMVGGPELEWLSLFAVITSC